MQCVHEVDEALGAGVLVHAAMSDEYFNETVRRITLFLDEGCHDPETVWEGAGINVSSIKAVCGDSRDETMLIREIQKKEGGFNRLDRVIAKFRKSVLPKEVRHKIEILEQCANLEQPSKWRTACQHGLCKSCNAEKEIIRITEIGDSHVIDAVSARQHHPDAHVRRGVVQVLAQITTNFDVRMLSVAEAYLEDEDETVRRTANEALQHCRNLQRGEKSVPS